MLNLMAKLILWCHRRVYPVRGLYTHWAGISADRLGPDGATGKFFAVQCALLDENGVWTSVALRGKTKDDVYEAVRQYAVVNEPPKPGFSPEVRRLIDAQRKAMATRTKPSHKG